MVVNLIMRPCRPRSFANQTGPRRSEQSGRADLFGAGQRQSDTRRVLDAYGVAPGAARIGHYRLLGRCY